MERKGAKEEGLLRSLRLECHFICPPRLSSLHSKRSRSNSRHVMTAFDALRGKGGQQICGARRTMVRVRHGQGFANVVGEIQVQLSANSVGLLIGSISMGCQDGEIFICSKIREG